MKLKIALLQLMPGNGLEEQYRIGEKACRQASEKGADIALFPEMWSCGYVFPQDRDSLEAMSLERESIFLKCFQSLACELQMAIGITYLESYGAFSRNSIVLFDMNGQRVLDYAKVHTCDFGDERVLTPGNDFYVNELVTREGSVKIGAMICYDREFPESGRILMLKGAEIVLVPNACPMEINRLSQLRGRAYENMFGIATCNYPVGKPDCNGHSSAFDGVAYLPELDSSRDTCLLKADGAEGIYIAEFDMDMLREYRSTEVHGNAYRKPEKYGLIISEKIDPPFIRKDRRR